VSLFIAGLFCFIVCVFHGRVLVSDSPVPRTVLSLQWLEFHTKSRMQSKTYMSWCKVICMLGSLHEIC
jgi:hypothetical protein